MHLLPYVIGNEDKGKYKNAANYIHLDQRRQWWQTFSKLKGWHTTDIPNVYTQGKLGEITAQPLLNYLVALYHISNQQTLDNNTNLNDIYRELTDNVYRRSWGEGANLHLDRSQLSQAEFAQVLQLVAVSAWHGSGRTATENEIEQTFKRFNKTKLLNKFELYKQDASDNKLTQLLTAFYFKKIGADNIGNHTFEFTHKSFEEYLVAQQLRSFLCKLPNWMEDEDIDANTLLKWVDLTGQTALNTYYFDFFY